MAGNIKERKRKVDLNTMSPEQQEQVGFEMGKKITALTDAAAKELTEKVNKITGIYGLEAVVQIAFKDQDGKIVS